MHDPLVWKQRIRTIRAFNYSAIMQAGVLRERLLHGSIMAGKRHLDDGA